MHSIQSNYLRQFTVLLAFCSSVAFPSTSFGLITGGVGNTPIRDPGWPTGAVEIFNHSSRVAWWEGPPFGGGQWHAECRGDAEALSEILAKFAKLEVKSKRIVLKDGVGSSFWLNPNRDPDKKVDATVDWVFIVWDPKSFARLKTLPVELNPTSPNDRDSGPPSELEVFTGGNVRWADVKVPDGLVIDDQRLEAHGFSVDDGSVVEGRVTDVLTDHPLRATIEMQRVEPLKKGGYAYPSIFKTTADLQGHWSFTKIPTGWFRLIAEKEGYAPRVIGHFRADSKPRWQAFDGKLSKATSLSVKVRDDSGKPLEGVTVRLDGVSAADNTRYDSSEPLSETSNDKGGAVFNRVPVGVARVHVFKDGFCRPGLGEAISLPGKVVTVTMIKAATVEVSVQFSRDREGEYLVSVEPEGGATIGSWGGSANLDATGKYSFRNVPPGRYVFRGQPNGNSKHKSTESQTIELKGGETVKVSLKEPQ